MQATFLTSGEPRDAIKIEHTNQALRSEETVVDTESVINGSHGETL
jgi:hypothetical protein